MARKIKLQSTGADRSELRRLLQAAKADHWDDGPRLAIADWLEEHGDESDRARADIIRLELDGGRGGPDWWKTISRLLTKHARDWLPAHHRFFLRHPPGVSRGLLAAEVPAKRWAAPSPCNEEWEWIEAAAPSLSPKDAVPFLESERLASVPRVRLDLHEFSHAAIQQALTVLGRSSVRALRLEIPEDAMDDLARHLRPGLHELAIDTESDIPWAGLHARDGMAGLRGLESPHLLTDADVAGMATHLGDLRRLDIHGSSLTSAGLASLAALPLRRLRFFGLGFRLDELGRLAEGRCRETLEELRIEQRRAEYGVGIPSVAAFPRLRRLALECRLTAEQAEALSGIMGRLDELDLRYNQGGIKRSMVDWAKSGLPGPRSLLLDGCYIGSRGAEQLAAWPGLSRVRHLSLMTNDIGEKAIRTLLQSPHAASLEALDLFDNYGASAAVVVDSPLKDQLTYLRLSGEESASAVVAALVRAKPARLREAALNWKVAEELDGGDFRRLRAALPECAIG